MSHDGDVTFFFDRDPLTKSTQYFHWDSEKEIGYIEDRQDVTAIIEQNKRDFNEATRYRLPTLGDKGLGRRVANIPMNILQQLMNERRKRDMSHEEWQQFLARWLDDPDNKVFRTDGSHVG